MSCELYKGVSTPIDSFIKYFLDVKPYHTKILEVLEKYRFQEDINLTIPETFFTNLVIANEPYCKPTGWGVDWDDACGFDAISCCDLFECVGGYGLIFDNSDLLVDTTILSADTELDKIVVQGNRTYDKKVQISSIQNNNTFTVDGDFRTDFNTNKIFLIIPRHTYSITSLFSDGFVISGNRVSEFVTRSNFTIYASSGNDGTYTTRTAVYDFSSNSTTIKINESFRNPSIGLGIVEIKSSNKNNGIYQVQSVVYNGVSTVVTVKDSVKQFTILNDSTFGSVQFRTGFIYPRYLNLTVNTFDPNPVNPDYKILQSVYYYESDTTEVSFTRKLSQDYSNGHAKLFGYMFQSGFDGDAECSAPKPFNIHAIFSEHLKINIKPITSVTPTPTRTPTPTPTSSRTPTVTPTITPTITPTLSVTPSAIIMEGTPRNFHTSNMLNDNTVLLIGGTYTDDLGGHINNTAQIYDEGTGLFTLTNSNMAIGRYLHTSTLLNDGTVLITGGIDIPSGGSIDTAEIYDPITKTFTQLSNNMTATRQGHTATLLDDGTVLIVGGVDNSGAITWSTAEIYDPIAQTFTATTGSMSSGRVLHLAIKLTDGTVLLVYGTDNPDFTGDIYDPITQTFTATTGSTNNRIDRGATIAQLNDGTILLAGGFDEFGTVIANAEIYDPNTQLFTNVPNVMNQVRQFHSGDLLDDGTVLLAGGFDNDANGIITAEIYDPISQTFTYTGNLKHARGRQTHNILIDNKILLAGGNDGFNDLFTAEIYNPLTGTFSYTNGVM